MALTSSEYKELAPKLSGYMTFTQFKDEVDGKKTAKSAILQANASGIKEIVVASGSDEAVNVKAALPYIIHHDSNFFKPGFEIYDVGYGQISKAFKLDVSLVKELHSEVTKARGEYKAVDTPVD